MQRTRLYFENPVGRLLEVEAPANCAIIQYKPGKRNFEEMQAFLTHTRHLLVSRNWYKILNDQREMTAFSEEERKWIADNWLNARPNGAQLYHVAVLLSHDVFARLSMNLIMNETRESGLVYRLFEEEGLARTWLLQLE
ncbi:hypothetical protein ACFPAF_12720 [Hymenobacter endophyticus]|uniref:STAS/SEC14 domain-containing protein n=1 Tax=Hymenobacter endophyticus TaxID=3076335 RepID=A0ABU3TIR3_9BACT|nr:hypothetical protein [Hymenobacter endophyticus]MDU0371263.1 hypothetical protein [Hymenobacter endophyticus]